MNSDLDNLLAVVVEHIEVPKTLYQRGADRHRSLAEWLRRPASLLREFHPDISPQGSFRYGTVNKPLNANDDFDLDNVCILKKLTKGDITQADLKRLYGEEIKSYANAHNMLAPVEEHNRCWRLKYADEVNFHLDTLPGVPEDPEMVLRLLELGVPQDLAALAFAIPDRKHESYNVLSRRWTSSNPRGFARWFEARATLGMSRSIVEKRLKASIENVPPYEWKTTLQRCIQILKRHRDVMFHKKPDLAPISMIITNLAAQAYGGETDLGTALTNIVARMGKFVQPTQPRVPNPTDPAEDYADKWSRDPRLERNFMLWLTSVQSDVANLPAIVKSTTLGVEIGRIFRVELTEQQLREFVLRASVSIPAAAKAAPAVYIPSGPKPWGANV